MTVHPLLAIIDAPIIIGILIVRCAALRAERLPEAGTQRRAGQERVPWLDRPEADEAAAKAREEARQRAAAQQADVMDNVQAGSISGEAVPPPTPGHGTPSS